MSKMTTQLSTLSTKVSNTLKVLAQIQEKREEELNGIPKNLMWRMIQLKLFLIVFMVTEDCKHC